MINIKLKRKKKLIDPTGLLQIKKNFNYLTFSNQCSTNPACTGDGSSNSCGGSKACDK